jgi:SAM-dependent methyltransferase
MQNVEQWKPSKYELRGGRLRGSRDRAELSVSSRLVADLVADRYDRALKDHVRGRLLDMGCGKVPLYASYEAFATSVDCIDWASGLHGNAYLDKICDLGGTIPYPDGSFDTIILSDVLEHLPEPMNCWREMNRLLAPGGKVILNVPFYYPLHEAPHDFYRYTEFALRRFAETSGFEVVELEPVGGALEILADVTAKLCAGAKLRPITAAIQACALRFTRTRIGSRLAKKSGERFPLGYFMVARKGAAT